MPVTPKNADKIYAIAEEKFNIAKTGMSAADFTRFGTALQEIKRERSSAEGEPISESHLQRILNEAGLVLDNACRSMKKTVRDKNADVVGKFTAVNDYLYATAMKELGCPNIPESFGTNTKNAIARYAAEVSSVVKLDADKLSDHNTYVAQRYKSAAFVEDKVGGLMSAVEEKNATPQQIGKLLAEYHALKKRQEDHGRFWRWFHGKENEDRNALLVKMESSLKGALGENADLEVDSINLAKQLYTEIEKNNTEAAFSAEDGMMKRLGFSEETSAVSSDEKDSTAVLRDNLKEDVALNSSKEEQPQHIEEVIVDNNKSLV